ncbi:DUF5677 domain-containing protein [Anaerotignum sp.]|uniref:DUF5677 domain-containing protein n=1 Tax=Anaerotignum sp. TaxID=2039241 RepID=UPI00289C24BA|nr:DUF5677 domain-containing protein [Anaerotignum sp.]
MFFCQNEIAAADVSAYGDIWTHLRVKSQKYPHFLANSFSNQQEFAKIIIASPSPNRGKSHFISDFQYFVFTKSTKSLMSIRTLLHDRRMEDVLIILRSMFEGYLASRYIDEEYEEQLLNDFLFVPQLIAHRKIIYDGKVAVDRDKNIIEFMQRNPSQMKLGKDKNYFFDLYEYLCNYAHCNFSILDCYLNEKGSFTCEKEVNGLLVRVLVLFVYTKIFESIVTVKGEDFLDNGTEKKCYKLVKEVTIFLDKRLEFFSKYDSDVNDELNKHMKRMFKNMRKSLKEEVGSLNKDFLA